MRNFFRVTIQYKYHASKALLQLQTFFLVFKSIPIEIFITVTYLLYNFHLNETKQYMYLRQIVNVRHLNESRNMGITLKTVRYKNTFIYIWMHNNLENRNIITQSLPAYSVLPTFLGPSVRPQGVPSFVC